MGTVPGGALARLAAPVWNAQERRPRGLIRIAIFSGAIALAWAGIGWLSMLTDGSLEAVAALYALLMLLVIGVTFVVARAVDRRPFADVGLALRRGYAVDLAFGAALGGVCMGAIAMFEAMLGWGVYALRPLGTDTLSAMLPAWGSTLTIFVSVAVIEEVVFRGYPVVNVAESLPGLAHRRDVAITMAVSLTSVAFGAAHAGNPGSSAIAVAYVAFGGMFLAMGLVLQGDLAIPIGAHFGWNFFQSLLGMQVSGQRFGDATLWTREERGPDVATGGPFGPEAGLEGLSAMVLGIVLTLAWVRLRQGRLQVHERFVRARGR